MAEHGTRTTKSDESGGLKTAVSRPAPAPRPAPASDSAAMLMRLQNAAGNQAASQWVGRQNGRPLDKTLRGEMETSFNTDLSGVRVHSSGDAAGVTKALGNRAITVGQDIAFAPGQFRPEKEAGRHMLAHELAHVVQQDSGQASTLARTGDDGERARLERDAEGQAQAVLAGDVVAPPVARSTATPVVQGFDPFAHRKATAAGLTGSFTPSEIGRVYQANWERDFSQGDPVFGDLVIGWKTVKLSAKADSKGQPSADSVRQFNNALSQLLSKLNLFNFLELKEGTAFGGYKYWEHMDNPGKDEAAKAEERWRSAYAGSAGAEGIPAYIKDSRAYVKESLARAVMGMGGGGDLSYVQQAWSGASRPPGYSGEVAGALPGATAVATEAATQATVPGALATATAGFTPGTADYLGRATHAIEDFFAHSNFLELAQRGDKVKSGELATGTVGMADSIFSLAQKIHAVVAEILHEKKNLGLMQAVIAAGPHAKAAKDNKREGVAGRLAGGTIGGAISGAILGGALGVLGPVGSTISGGLAGGVLGAFIGKAIGGTAGAWIGGILGAIGGALAGFFGGPLVGIIGLGLAGLPAGFAGAAKELAPQLLTSERLLRDLEKQATKMEKWAAKHAAAGSHTRLAKDQPGADAATDPAALKRKREFELALRLATEANRLIFTKVKAAMGARGYEVNRRVHEVYDTVDAILTIPSDKHPLIHIVRKAKAETDANSRSKEKKPQ